MPISPTSPTLQFSYTVRKLVYENVDNLDISIIDVDNRV